MFNNHRIWPFVLWIWLLFLNQGTIYAQGFPSGGLSTPFGRGTSTLNQDSVKKDSLPPRPKKPKYFPKSIRADIHWFHLDTLRFIDSQLLLNHRYTQQQRSFQPILELGTPGSPQINLVNGIIKSGFTLGLPLADSYIITPEQFEFYQVGQPYTRFQYSQGAGGYTGLEALHTQNFSPTWNIAINYRSSLNEDHYTGANQDNLLRNLGIGSSFISENGRYENELIFSWNRNRRVENGGYLSDTLFYGTTQNNSVEPQIRAFGIYVPKLNSANSFYSFTKHRLNHRYYLSNQKQHYLYHQLAFNNERFTYQDENRDTTVYGANYRILPLSIDDSTSLQSGGQQLGWGFTDTFDKNIIRIQAGLVYQHATLLYQSKDSIHSANFFNSNGYKIGLHWLQPNSWISTSWQHQISGYLTKNYTFELLGHYKFNDSSFVNAAYVNEQSSPNLYHTYFQNNHIDLRGIINTQHLMKHHWIKGDYQYHSQKLDFHGSIQLGESEGEIRAIQSFIPQILSKYQYIQTTLGVRYEFFKNWLWFSSVHLQRNNAREWDQLGLPTWFGRMGLSYQNDAFSRALIYRLGFDLQYTSEYASWQYRPDVRQFFAGNNNINLGNYPVFDVFFSGRIQTVDFFLKYEHFNNWWVIPSLNSRYESTLNYPIQPDRFRFGFIWNFWN